MTQRKSFLEPFASQKFQFKKCNTSPEIMSKWEELKMAADVYSFMMVKSNYSCRKSNSSKDEWDGRETLFFCVLASEHLFLCNTPPGYTESSYWQINPSHIAQPAYYTMIEFSKLKTLWTSENKPPEGEPYKCGFALQVKDVFHELRIKLFRNHVQSRNKSNNVSPNVLIDDASHSKVSVINGYRSPTSRVNNKIAILETEQHVKKVYKRWMGALNQWVVRDENLKKFLVQS